MRVLASRGRQDVRIAVTRLLEGGEVGEWLEDGPRLPQRLCAAVELRGAIIAAAHHCLDRPGLWLDDDQTGLQLIGGLVGVQTRVTFFEISQPVLYRLLREVL